MNSNFVRVGSIPTNLPSQWLNQKHVSFLTKISLWRYPVWFGMYSGKYNIFSSVAQLAECQAHVLKVRCSIHLATIIHCSSTVECLAHAQKVVRFDSHQCNSVPSMTFKLLNSYIAYSIVGICIGIDRLVDILYNKAPWFITGENCVWNASTCGGTKTRLLSWQSYGLMTRVIRRKTAVVRSHLELIKTMYSK